MNPVWVQPLWSRIGQEWDAIPEEVKPWGVWITRHAPLAAANIPSLQEAPLLQAWFFEAGMERPHDRSGWAFTRFWVMHFKRPWDVADCASPDPRFSARCYPLGHATFAPYADSQDVCLETIWGGRWGMGSRLTLTPEGLIERGQLLWIA
ncbi:MAG TPA: hypothetical protein VF812_00685 [Ktedonobacterales bacterium]